MNFAFCAHSGKQVASADAFQEDHGGVAWIVSAQFFSQHLGLGASFRRADFAGVQLDRYFGPDGVSFVPCFNGP
jgi:hypothetical protein